MTLLAVSAAGAVGAVLRHLLSGWAQQRVGSGFPVGTLAVNLGGSLGLGLVAGMGSLDSVMTLSVVAFLAGFTTFSTWMVETMRLGPFSVGGMVNLAVSLGGGVGMVAIGYTLTS